MPGVGPLAHASRITAAIWCLSCVVFVYVYNGSLISYIAVPRLIPFANTMEEFANSNELEPATMKSHFFETIILVP